MKRVIVLDANQNPLDPCHPARARELLRKGRAKVHCRHPFTIILIDKKDIAEKGEAASSTSMNG